MKKARLFFKIILVNVVVLLVVFLIWELSWRARVNNTVADIVTTQQDFIICTEEFIDVPHPLLGFYYKPGDYDCHLNTRQFNMSLLSDSSRNTGFLADSACPDPLKIDIFGCSYTWGHGLFDEETMAYKIQQGTSCTQVKNYGIGGGSTVQSYLLLQSLIERGQKPDVAILNYGSIHDERNAFTGAWRQMWEYLLLDNRVGKKRIYYGDLEMPYAEPVGEKDIAVKWYPVHEITKKFPLSDKSFILNWIHKTTLKSQIDNHTAPDLTPAEKQDISIRMLAKMRDLCMQYGIHFIVTGIYKDEPTKAVLDKMPSMGIFAVDISVDILKPGLNLEPDDSHPNGAANTEYANTVLHYLRVAQLIEEQPQAAVTE